MNHAPEVHVQHALVVGNLGFQHGAACPHSGIVVHLMHYAKVIGHPDSVFLHGMPVRHINHFGHDLSSATAEQFRSFRQPGMVHI